VGGVLVGVVATPGVVSAADGAAGAAAAGSSALA
jgi:hypothetical protein